MSVRSSTSLPTSTRLMSGQRRACAISAAISF
jgi:hypothetical protein